MSESLDGNSAIRETSVKQDDSLADQEINSKRDKDDTYPFVCGFCYTKFKDSYTFNCHLNSHYVGGLSSNFTEPMCHCDNYAESKSESEEIKVQFYTCTICETAFTSICALHNHIVNCSADGSYIYDNTSKMVYPLTIHCSYIEPRGSDNMDMTIENIENQCCCQILSQNVSKYLSRAEKVNHILRMACKVIENIELKLERKDESECNVSTKTVDSGQCKNNRSAKNKSGYNKDSVSVTDKVMQSDKNYALSKRKKRKSTKNVDKKLKKTNKELFKSENPMAKQDLTKHAEEVNGEVEVKKELTPHDTETDLTTDSTTKKLTNVENCLKKSGSGDVNIVDECNEVLDNNSIFRDDMSDDDDDLTDEYTPDNPEFTRVYKKGKNKNTVKKKGKQSLMKKLTNNNGERKSCKQEWNSIYEKVIGENGIVLKKSAKNTKGRHEKCSFCGKTFESYRLKMHLMSHIEQRPFQCELCPKSYKYHGHLETHKASHQEVKPYCCEICGKGYLTTTMLRHHSMMKHWDQKPCNCDICGASFITNYKLSRHMAKHTGKKDVQCDLCGMAFTTKYNLSQHVQGVHKKTRRFTCAVCGQHFMTNYQLKVHSIKKHTEERPYKCNICKAEYVERKELRRHLKKQHNMSMDKTISALTEMPVKEGLFVDSETRVFQQPELIDGTDQRIVLEQENREMNRLGKKLVIQSDSGRRETTMQDIQFSVKPETMECMGPDTVVSVQDPGLFKRCGTQDLLKPGSGLVEPKKRVVVEQVNGNENKILASTYPLTYSAIGKDKLYTYANIDNSLNSQVKHIPKTVYQDDFSQPENLAFDSTTGEYVLVPYEMPKDFVTENDNRNKFRQQEMQMYPPSAVSGATNSAHISTGQTSVNFTVL